MTTTDLERRMAKIEKKVEALTAQGARATNKDWLLDIWGSFANDPDFKKAADYGRQWRQAENRKSLRAAKSTRSKKRPK